MIASSKASLRVATFGALAIVGSACQLFLSTDVSPDASLGPFVSEDFASVGDAPRLLAMNDKHLFVVGKKETVTRVDRATRAVESLPTPATGAHAKPISLLSLAADANSILFTAKEDNACGSPVTVWRSPTDTVKFVELGRGCGPVSAVASDSVDVVYTDWTKVYAVAQGSVSARLIATGVPPATALYTTSAVIYVANDTTKSIVAISKFADAGGAFASTNAAPMDIVADELRVYWIEGDGSVMSRALASDAGADVDAGGPTTVTLAQAGLGAAHLAQDTTHLYVTNPIKGVVLMVAKTGGAPDPIATGQKEPFDIVADDSAVYWINRAAGTIGRAARKP